MGAERVFILCWFVVAALISPTTGDVTEVVWTRQRPCVAAAWASAGSLRLLGGSWGGSAVAEESPAAAKDAEGHGQQEGMRLILAPPESNVQAKPLRSGVLAERNFAQNAPEVLEAYLAKFGSGARDAPSASPRRLCSTRPRTPCGVTGFVRLLATASQGAAVGLTARARGGRVSDALPARAERVPAHRARQGDGHQLRAGAARARAGARRGDAAALRRHQPRR
jgi:hypothetical protein